ncbi:MAG: outer membrane protein Omp28 [Bacteroidetes bacterium]|jgi:hypothetical protein|nr:outer membrane protein Omp28 [Bacteroidota bacterium]
MKKHLLSFVAASLTVSAFAQLPASTTPALRKVVVEEFTGIHCQYCPDGHKKADQLIAANPNGNFVINVHVGGYSTPGGGEPDFRTSFGTSLVNQTSLTGYPAGTVNRHLFPGYSQNTSSPGTAMSRSLWASAAGQIESLPSIVNVAFQGTLDAATNILTVDVEAYYTGTSTVSTNYFNLALLQDSIDGTQTGGSTWYPANYVNGMYQHNKVLRHLITGQWGDVISNPTAGSLFAKTYTYTVANQYPIVLSGGVQTNVVLKDLKLVAFVTETQQEILSGNKGPITIINSSPTAIKSNSSEKNTVFIFPNPTSGNSTVGMELVKQEDVSIKVINMLGSEVYSYKANLEKGIHYVDINSANLSSGVYFVEVIQGKKSTTEKLIINK